ncbi:hypothetical protein AX15_005112 [Amanita polypyramis BW_CC]|nr:hypothetical protein AX15_005112 [Amanita polypyramis BW_CC]
MSLKLSVLLLSFAVASRSVAVINESPVNLALSRHVNVTNMRNLVRHDQARAHILRERAGKASQQTINEPIDNVAVTYVASIGVGSPATYYNLIVDTGSSNTWVGAGKKYVRTRSSKQTRDTVSVQYGSGSFKGTEYVDNVTIEPGFTIRQSIGVATTAIGFTGYDGILGIGPVDLTRGTLSPDTNKIIPTVTDNAYNQGFLRVNKIGISFEPTVLPSTVNGELSWGGIDRRKFTGPITYAPITSTFPSSLYWGIDQSITYGDSTDILTDASGIVDTGTTLIMLASDAFATYVSATGGVMDHSVGLLTITPTQYANLESLFFEINGDTFELTPNAQIWPRSLNTLIGGKRNRIYLIVIDIGKNSGSGLDFINGFTFLERFYTIYDTTRQAVGFATTPYTYSTSN